MTTKFESIEGYLDEHGSLSQVTDSWLAAAIEGGYTTQERASELLAQFCEHPPIAEIYPYPSLCAALRTATAPGGWTPENEEALLLFLQAIQPMDHYEMPGTLLSAPAHLFGDLYASLFYTPSKALDLKAHVVEFTGTFRSGTHKDLGARAGALGAAIASRWSFPTMLFVADAHIAERILSRKMLDAITSQAKRGWRVLIVSESHFPA